MTRKVVLDTETTGLEVERGHRVVEIGCVELVDRRPSGRTFHCYLNPGRAVDPGAVAIHGLTDEFLRDKPAFDEIAADFIAFIDGSELLIHNASFDVAFLDAELRRVGGGSDRVEDHAGIVDTLAMARARYPGQKNTLDALCKRLGVDNSRREMHGALLDAQLLADVWIAMTAGQGALALGAEPAAPAAGLARTAAPAVGVHLRVQRASDAESASHLARLATLDKAAGGSSVWKRLESDPAESEAGVS